MIKLKEVHGRIGFVPSYDGQCCNCRMGIYAGKEFSDGGKPHDAKEDEAKYYEGKVLRSEVSEGSSHVLRWKVIRRKVVRRETSERNLNDVETNF